MQTIRATSTGTEGTADGLRADYRSRASRLALTKQEAAAAIGVSVDSFERHVQPELAVVRRGRLRLFAVCEIERWLRENSVPPLGSGR